MDDTGAVRHAKLILLFQKHNIKEYCFAVFNSKALPEA